MYKFMRNGSCVNIYEDFCSVQECMFSDILCTICDNKNYESLKSLKKDSKTMSFATKITIDNNTWEIIKE